MIISKQIEKRAKSLPEGTILSISDFTDAFDYDTARKVLQRMQSKGQIMRLSRGIYYIPKKDELIGIIKPSAEQIAEAIAKRDKARILPTGSYALYKLGLSTQIPMNVVYLTDGSPRIIQIGKQKISFKKTSSRNLAVKHRLTALIIQGLKALGEGNINVSELDVIKQIIERTNEKDKIIENLRFAPVWINRIISGLIKTG
jgi:hypothetical protein